MSFFKKNFGKEKKTVPPPPPKSLFENTMKNPCLEHNFLGQNAPFKKKHINYLALSQKSAFGFDPRPREVPEPENT